MKILNILIILFAVSLNFEVYAWFNISTNGISTNDIFTLISVIVFLKLAVWDGMEFKIAKNPAVLFFLMFFATAFISGITPLLSGEGSHITQYFKTIINFCFIYSILFILILNRFENETWNSFIRVWLILSIFINIFGVYQIIARALDLPFAWFNLTSASFFSRNMNEVDELSQLSLRFESFFRATSFFSEPSALGAFNGITITFALIPGIKKLKPFIKSKFLNFIIIFFTIIGLLLAFSLTGVAIVSILIFTLFLTERLNVFSKMLKILPFAIILIYIADVMVENYSGISVLEMFGMRFGSIANIFTGAQFGSGIDGESVTTRSENFASMVAIWQSSPLIGVGLGLTYLSPYADGWAFSDNSFGAVLAELGILGVLAYLLIFISIYVVGFKILNQSNVYNKLDDNTKRLISIAVNLMGYLFVTNFLSANNLINIASVFFIGMIYSITNNYYIDYPKNYFTFKFVNKPIKLFFVKKNSENLGKYIL